MVQFFLWCWWLNCVRSFLSSKPKLIGTSVKQYFILFFLRFLPFAVALKFSYICEGKVYPWIFSFPQSNSRELLNHNISLFAFLFKKQKCMNGMVKLNNLWYCYWMLMDFVSFHHDFMKKKTIKCKKKEIQTDL